MQTLEHLKENAYRAFTGTSFVPEKRAEYIINEYSKELDIDLLEVEKIAPDYAPKYKEKYIQLLTAWLGAKSNCISSMIAGPSNFPVRRAQKAIRSEQNKHNEFREWREKIFKSFEKQEKKQAIEDAGGELEIAKAKLKRMQDDQERMKKLNKAHAAYVKNPKSIEKGDLTESEKNAVINWRPSAHYYTKPFERFHLTNNLARIKSTEVRIKDLEKKESLSDKENKIFDIVGGKLELNFKADRIQIFNDERPERSIIDSYKKHGLKWSPFNRCWQRQITNNALYSMQQLFNVKL
jgi:hypothetical protein